MKHYYLPFPPMAKIDYVHLLALYDLAEYQTDTGTFDTIRYTSSAALAEQVKLSSSTISRILKSEKYADFLIVDREHKVITLNNNFRKSVCTFSHIISTFCKSSIFSFAPLLIIKGQNKSPDLSNVALFDISKILLRLYKRQKERLYSKTISCGLWLFYIIK